MNDEAYLIYGH